MITFRTALIKDSLEAFIRLSEEHWDETEAYREEQGYDPDFVEYMQLNENGQFKYFLAEEEGDTVGQLGFIIHTSRHTCRKNAVEDFFFLTRSARKGTNAVKFLRYAIEELKQIGCAQIGMSSKLTNDIEPLLKRVGFDYVAKFYTMNVEENL